MEPFVSIRLNKIYSTDEKLFNELLLIMDRHLSNGDDVWLTTCGGFPSLNYHKKLADNMKKQAKVLKEHGFKVTLQFANTIGHGGLNAKSDAEEFASHMIDIDGKEMSYISCPNNEKFLKYIYNVSSIYAEINPDYIYPDDDLRTVTGRQGCFCNDCIKKFNEINNFNYTRKELGILLFEENNETVSVKWRDFCDLSLSRVMEAVILGAQEKTKDFSIGMQTGTHIEYEQYKRVCRKVIELTGKKPLLRAGGGEYCDRTPFDLFKKSIKNQRQCEYFSGLIENFRPELEGYPHTILNKSPRGFNTEASLSLAYGCTALSYAAIPQNNEPLELFEPLFKSINEYRPYFLKLAEISENTSCGGLLEAMSAKKLIKNNSSVNLSKEMECLLLCGVPMAYTNRECDLYYIDAQFADVTTKGNLEKVLKSNIIIEPAAVEILNKRGFGGLLNLNITKDGNNPDVEILSNDILNKGIEGNRWICPTWLDNEEKYFFDENDGIRVLARYENNNPCAVIANSKFGKKIACIGATGSDVALLNSSKATMIKRLVSELTDCGYGYVTAPCQTSSILRLDKNKKLKAITVFNYGMEFLENVEFFAKNTSGEKMTVYAPKENPGEIKEKVIPSLAPGGIATVIFNS